MDAELLVGDASEAVLLVLTAVELAMESVIFLTWLFVESDFGDGGRRNLLFDDAAHGLGCLEVDGLVARESGVHVESSLGHRHFDRVGDVEYS